jgi:hypothetical protein
MESEGLAVAPLVMDHHRINLTSHPSRRYPLSVVHQVSPILAAIDQTSDLPVSGPVNNIAAANRSRFSVSRSLSLSRQHSFVMSDFIRAAHAHYAAKPRYDKAHVSSEGGGAGRPTLINSHIPRWKLKY